MGVVVYGFYLHHHEMTPYFYRPIGIWTRGYLSIYSYVIE